MRILDKKTLAEDMGVKITQLEIEAPQIANSAKPGQFVVLMVKEEGERIPLTLVETDTSEGSIRLIFQEIGLSTRLLGKLEIGDSLYALVGPLGKPTEVKNYGRVILIGGGVGIAEIYPVATAFKEVGNSVTVIIGARSRALLILEDELRRVSDALYIATDDGSYGEKGFTTDILKRILSSQPSTYELIYAVGPIPMMRKVAEISQEHNIRVVVSLNALMLDATGMCGCCRVSVGGEVKFSCLDGPEFDGRLIDWDELEKRTKIYQEKERHICNLYRL